jgi:hypothetical protein
MGGQPDVALVDVSLEGGREGIEAGKVAARGLRGADREVSLT